MGKTPVNAALGELHGKIDDYVFRDLAGETIVARKPRPFKVPPSDEQVRVQGVFRQAAQYAYHVYHDEDKAALKAKYQANAERRGVPAGRLFPFIVQDAARSPVIENIDASLYDRHIGSQIQIVATDECEVTGVSVKLMRQDDSTVIEQGAARNDGKFWRYVATAEAPAGIPLVLEVTATDLAENRTTERMGIIT